jgi:hypothetical protein
MIYINNGGLVTHEKEQNYLIYNTTDGTGDHHVR